MANQESCQLFIILPEHEDAEKTSSCIRDFSVMSLEEVTGYIRLIDTMECRGQAEHYQLYYDSKNIDSFLKPVQELPECYPSVELTFATLSTGLQRTGGRKPGRMETLSTDCFMRQWLTTRSVRPASGNTCPPPIRRILHLPLSTIKQLTEHPIMRL